MWDDVALESSTVKMLLDVNETSIFGYKNCCMLICGGKFLCPAFCNLTK